MFCTNVIKPTTVTQRVYNKMAFNKVKNGTYRKLINVVNKAYLLLIVYLTN